ncbi:hypothetical protein MSPP1_002637 [Malassezia sp. CBS 17886]|nr:hypothetical protein MSPP1_002637 [Malassezia sp. CBS 17886]
MAPSLATVDLAVASAARLQPRYRQISSEEHAAETVATHLHDAHMAQFGYRSGDACALPPHLVRHLEPTENEFDCQVEYDMDEQDQRWLDALNEERSAQQLDVISYETFEILLDRLEKEWFTLVKRIPSRFAIGAAADEDEFPEESLCAICDDGECENANAIVFCDGCNLVVHQDCYGIPYIPEGQWLCRKCTVSPDRPVGCVLCPQEGGAFKQTVLGAWAHLLCAMWIPETGVSNAVYMEPIDGVEDIPRARWRLRCYLCHRRQGACIQCEHRSCFTAFHVTCARKAGLLRRAPRDREEGAAGDAGNADLADAAGAAPMRTYCHRHLPRSERAALRARVCGEDADASDSDLSVSALMAPSGPSAYESIASKSARAYNKLYSSGPLPVPNYIVDRVSAYTARLPLRRKAQTVAQIVRYWSLKRQQMRGAPLLKRLHIEPWTVGNFVEERTNALKLAKLQHLYRLREDLEKVRLLTELVRKREKAKLRGVRLFQTHVVQRGMLCLAEQLRAALHEIMRHVVHRSGLTRSYDRTGWFAERVSECEAPGYCAVIKEPMDWATIRARIDGLAYASTDAFVQDVHLVTANAQSYNPPDTPVSRAALRVQKGAAPVLARLAATAADARALRLEPPETVVHLLGAPRDTASRAEFEGTGAEPVGHSEGALNAVDEFLHQGYTVARTPSPPCAEPAPPPPAPGRARKRQRDARVGPPPAPARRSARHGAGDEPAGTQEAAATTEPRMLEELNAKDSFNELSSAESV